MPVDEMEAADALFRVGPAETVATTAELTGRMEGGAACFVFAVSPGRSASVCLLAKGSDSPDRWCLRFGGCGNCDKAFRVRIEVVGDRGLRTGD